MSVKQSERYIEKIIRFFGIISIIVVFMIFLFLFIEASPVLTRIGIKEFIFSEDWIPTGTPPSFGIFSLIYGTIVVTVGAIFFSVPLGIMCAVYISEFACGYMKEFIKSVIEILAGVPSVVYGFFGLIVIVPIVQSAFGLATGETAFTGAILLAIMILPTVITISEDALSSVPVSFREASLALGATKIDTIFRVIIPAARSGISTAIVLGIGRAIGETMTVLMVTGGSAIIPDPFYNILSPVRTMTATLAAEMGETVVGSEHYVALFGIGVVLFVITFFINLIATTIIGSSEKV